MAPQAPECSNCLLLPTNMQMLFFVLLIHRDGNHSQRAALARRTFYLSGDKLMSLRNIYISIKYFFGLKWAFM